jgi:hypothetical protein
MPSGVQLQVINTVDQLRCQRYITFAVRGVPKRFITRLESECEDLLEVVICSEEPTEETKDVI